VAAKLTGTVVRLDDRMIHGQILYGWVIGWPADEVWLVGDKVAADEKERQIYEEVISSRHITGGVCTTDEMVAELRERPRRGNCLIVVCCIDTAQSLVRSCKSIVEIDLAQRSGADDRKELLPNVHLTEEEIALLGELENEGIPVMHRDLPGDEPVSVAAGDGKRGGVR